MQFTTIHHAARKQFDLSCNEYCIADMIFILSANPKAPVVGWCNQSRGNMAGEMGLSRRAVIDIVQTLIAKGLVERNATDFLRTTSRWYDAVTDAKENLKRGVQIMHTPNDNACAETAHPVQKLHTECAETAHPPCAETAHNKESNNKKSNNSLVGSGEPSHPRQSENSKKETGGAYPDAFEAIWKTYAKPSSSKKKAYAEWAKLKPGEQEKAMTNLAHYLAFQPDPRFRKDPERWFRDRAFEADYRTVNDFVPVPVQSMPSLRLTGPVGRIIQ